MLGKHRVLAFTPEQRLRFEFRAAVMGYAE